MSTDVQRATGYDHVGQYESSILMSLYRDAVKLEGLGEADHWYTKSAAKANRAPGDRMVDLSLEYLEKK